MILLVAIAVIHLFYFDLRPSLCCLKMIGLLFFNRRLSRGTPDLGIDLAAYEQHQSHYVQPEHQYYDCAEAAISRAVVGRVSEVERKGQRAYDQPRHRKDGSRRNPAPLLFDVRP